MRPTQFSRRAFHADYTRVSASSWLALHLPWLSAVAAAARDDARRNAPFTHLTPAEARTMRALAAQIIPSDDGARGAEEAGAAYFVDRALGAPFFAELAPLIREGLADLDARAWWVHRWRRGGFALLSASEQVSALRQVEHREFFSAARALVLIGTFAESSCGDTQDGDESTATGEERRSPPQSTFGWYDARLGDDPPPRAA